MITNDVMVGELAPGDWLARWLQRLQRTKARYCPLQIIYLSTDRPTG